MRLLRFLEHAVPNLPTFDPCLACWSWQPNLECLNDQRRVWRSLLCDLADRWQASCGDLVPDHLSRPIQLETCWEFVPFHALGLCRAAMHSQLLERLLERRPSYYQPREHDTDS